MDVHSPHSVRVGIPFFRHKSEGVHGLSSWTAHCINEFYLHMLREIEVRAIKTNRELAKQHITNKAVPEVVLERSKPMDQFCKIYQEGADQDTLAKLEDTISENHDTIRNIVIEAFGELDRSGQKELRKDKIRRKIINQAISANDPDLKNYLYKQFKECYLFIVKKPFSSNSMTEVSSLSNFSQRRNSKHWRLKKEQEEVVVVVYSPPPPERKDIFSRSVSPDTLAHPPTPREQREDDDYDSFSTDSDDEGETSLI